MVSPEAFRPQRPMFMFVSEMKINKKIVVFLIKNIKYYSVLKKDLTYFFVFSFFISSFLIIIITIVITVISAIIVSIIACLFMLYFL